MGCYKENKFPKWTVCRDFNLPKESGIDFRFVPDKFTDNRFGKLTIYSGRYDIFVSCKSKCYKFRILNKERHNSTKGVLLNTNLFKPSI